MERDSEYAIALRAMLARNRALWFILSDLMMERCKATDDPEQVAKITCERVLWALDQKDEDAKTKGLQVPLAAVKEQTQAFFVDVLNRLAGA